MANQYAQSTLVEFNIVGKNGFVKQMIEDFILSQADLNELRAEIKRYGSNKIYKCLHIMRKRRLEVK